MKIGLDQINKPTPKRVKAICEAISYTLAGVAAISWVQNNPDYPVILLLLAGAIDKFAPRIFGYDDPEDHNNDQGGGIGGAGIAMLIFMILLCSCGTSKKNLNKQQNEIQVKLDSISKIKTKTTDQIDTNIIVPADTTKANIDESDSCEQVFETPDIKIVVGPKKTGSSKRPLQVINKQKTIPVKINRVTETDQQTKVSKSIDQETESVISEKTSSGWSIPWWLYFAFFGVVLGVGWWIRKNI